MKSYLRTNNTHSARGSAAGGTRLPKIKRIPSAVHVGLWRRAYMHYIHRSIPFLLVFPLFVCYGCCSQRCLPAFDALLPTISSFNSACANKCDLLVRTCGICVGPLLCVLLSFVSLVFFFLCLLLLILGVCLFLALFGDF